MKKNETRFNLFTIFNPASLKLSYGNLIFCLSIVLVSARMEKLKRHMAMIVQKTALCAKEKLELMLSTALEVLKDSEFEQQVFLHIKENLFKYLLCKTSSVLQQYHSYDHGFHSFLRPLIYLLTNLFP